MLGKKARNSSKIAFLWLMSIIYSVEVAFFTLKMVHSSVLYDFPKTTCFEKIWFFSLSLKCFQPIRLQDSLIINICKRNHLISQYVRLPPCLGGDSCAFHPIRLLDSLIINISGKDKVISQFFCMKLVTKGKQHLRLLLLVECGHLCLFSNQSARFFDCQYL